MKFVYLIGAVLSTSLLVAWQLQSPKTQETPQRPNILFCIADDASWQHMSAYGLADWVSTPGFDRVAREGVLFANAYTPNAKCAPSRSCILTGRNPWQLEEAANHVPYFPAKFTTFMEALTTEGYRVGYTGKGWAPGNPGERNGNPRLLTGQAYNEKQLKAPTKAISANDYTGNFEAFLQSRNPGEPFCFWYGGHEPHRVYEYGSGLKKTTKKTSDIDRVPAYWPDNETVRTDMLDYAYEVEYFDQHLSKMLTLLEQRGELDNTIIVVTSDNGMPFPRVKGHVYEYANHLPLAILWKKGITHPGRTIQDMVSFIDFAPTLLEAAGVKPQVAGMQPMQGQSLMGILKSEQSGKIEKKRDHVLLGKERTDVGRPGDAGYPVRGIVKGNYIYTINYETDRWPAGNPETGYLDTDGSPTKTEILAGHRQGKHEKLWQLSFGKKGGEELYRIKEDAYAMENLADNPAYASIKRKLRTQLEKELKAQQDPRMFGKGAMFDQFPYAEAATRNFYERFMKGEKVKAGWVNESDFEKREN
jgi:N-sulfoglucosamine sulfohydrolase